MNQITTIHFVRHGLVRNPNEIYYGRLLGFPLDVIGQKQAQATQEFFSDKSIEGFYCSPQVRARETIQIIAKPHEGKQPVVSELLNEVYSPFDGSPKSLLDSRDWDLYTGVDQTFEQPNDVLNRGQRFISETRMGHSGQQIIAVSHGDLIAFMMLWAKGTQCTPVNKRGLYANFLGYASIASFTFEAAEDGKFIGMEYTNPASEVN